MFVKRLAVLVLAGASGLCAAKDLCSYPDTSGLVSDTKFASGIRSFFGSEKLTYFSKGHSTADQLMTWLGGPPDEVERIGDGLMFASACRAHSCVEKAAVVMACPNTVIAVGIFYYDLSSVDRPPDWTSRPHLMVYSADDNPVALGAIQAWAKQAADGYNETLTTHVRAKSRTGLFGDAQAK